MYAFCLPEIILRKIYFNSCNIFQRLLDPCKDIVCGKGEECISVQGVGSCRCRLSCPPPASDDDKCVFYFYNSSEFFSFQLYSTFLSAINLTDLRSRLLACGSASYFNCS